MKASNFESLNRLIVKPKGKYTERGEVPGLVRMPSLCGACAKSPLQGYVKIAMRWGRVFFVGLMWPGARKFDVYVVKMLCEQSQLQIFTFWL